MGVGTWLARAYREFRFEISGTLFVLGIVLVVIALLGYVPQLRDWVKSVGLLDTMLKNLGGWIFWEAILAGVVMLMGAFTFGDTMKKVREFERLINTTSKEVFLKNRKRLEDLAEVYLPARYERRVEKKRLELKVRD